MAPRSHTKNQRKGCPNRAALTPFWLLLQILLFTIAISSCKKDSYPKPTAYPRIAYPTADYRQTQLAAVLFEYPTYASIDRQAAGKENWINLRFEPYGATLFMSLIKVPMADLDQMIREKEKLAIEQAPPASEVRKEEFEATDHRFTGYFYLTDGNAPCPVQFLLSNHKDQLFQGSLLFDTAINRDSLASVVNGLTRDVRHLVETFQFKN